MNPLLTSSGSAHFSFKAAFKACRLKTKQRAGRNSSGRITSYHRGGGSKRLYRQIDFRRDLGELRVDLGTKVNEISLSVEGSKTFDASPNVERNKLPRRGLGQKIGLSPIVGAIDNLLESTICIGSVQKFEYDPNRSARIALIKWVLPSQKGNSLYEKQQTISELSSEFDPTVVSTVLGTYTYFSYIVACEKLCVGDQIINSGNVELNDSTIRNKLLSFKSVLGARGTSTSSVVPRSTPSVSFEPITMGSPTEHAPKAITKESHLVQNLALPTKVGNSGPLSLIPLGSFIHNIEIKPGRGGQLVRSAGAYAQLIQNREDIKQTIVRLPSGMVKQLDSRCRATIGTVSNSSHSINKLKKAGQNRWLGKRPIVRGVAMNPIDHPHGGGEGRTKGGRPSVSPWGKPTKGGFKTSRRVLSIQKWL